MTRSHLAVQHINELQALPTVLNLGAFLGQLRSEGYAVTIFTPTELRGANPDVIEEIMCERGSIAIQSLATEKHEDFEFHAAPI